ncbi:MAG TPA: YbaB/EbfC family nucleoid-associated protein [Phycisphaerae bacterium]|nr:YbaB/EbfC family nucleoid-associated protein [Phycisphaerae bacterium]
MFGKLGELGGMLKQVSEMKARMAEMQEKAVTMRFEAESGAGAVRATVNGKMELANIKISPEAVRPDDVEMLEDLIRAAVAAAQKKAMDGMKDEMQKLTGGMNIPGLDAMMGG